MVNPQPLFAAFRAVAKQQKYVPGFFTADTPVTRRAGVWQRLKAHLAFFVLSLSASMLNRLALVSIASLIGISVAGFDANSSNTEEKDMYIQSAAEYPLVDTIPTDPIPIPDPLPKPPPIPDPDPKPIIDPPPYR
ncbi:hypothetical protein RBA63_21350 [Brenneria goodwinii]|uniref:hypothetical protein n=1 Tax=Brenneria goodwinii TaxID=1109412 RepID=UPI0036DFE7CC